MKQFKKSDLKVGYLVELEDGTLCKLEQLQNNYIGLISENDSWIVTLNDEESDDYDENLRDKSNSDYNINEIYGYSDNGYGLYKPCFRELLWERESVNSKRYEIKCIVIEPNYVEGYKTKSDDKIWFTTLDTEDEENELSVSLSISNAKELIESLQEIVDYVEGKDE